MVLHDWPPQTRPPVDQRPAGERVQVADQVAGQLVGVRRRRRRSGGLAAAQERQADQVQAGAGA